MSLEIWATATIECAHTSAPLGVPALHGHSYWIDVFSSTDDANPTPLAAMQQAMSKIVAALDHRNLDEVLAEGTMECIALYVARNWQGPTVSRVRVRRESIGCGVEWRA